MRHAKGAAVVLRRKHALLGVVVHVSANPPRYHVQPARLVGGQVQVIAAALAVPHVRGSQLAPFDPATSASPWN